MQRILLFTVALLNVLVNAHTQSWTNINVDQVEDLGIKDIQPATFRLYQVDDSQLKDILWKAPLENSGESAIVLSVPLSNGAFDDFKIFRYRMMHPDLEKKWDYIRTFHGISKSNPYRSIVIDYTMQGFRAMISDPATGQVFIDHFQRNDNSSRIVYKRSDYRKFSRWQCEFNDEHNLGATFNSGNRELLIGDCKLREYTLALACTGEYATFHGGTVPLVASAMTTSLNRVNGVYRRELGLRLVLVANNNNLIFLNGGTDPYTNDNGSAMLGQNQTTCDNTIGNANYDIGHVFSTGGGGVAYPQSLCNNSTKAGGVTGQANPVGDPFDIDYVAHEMGHQFGGNHTQNNNCNRNSNTAMEPGSASSIMGYAGICSPDVALHSDPEYHAISLQEIKTYLQSTNGNSCATEVSTSSAPNVTIQSNYTIPASTAFSLNLAATDPNGYSLVYSWDQMNNQIATMPPAATNTVGPAFRFLSPTPDSRRYFPNLSAILTGSLTGMPYSGNNWEVIPSVARTMNFRGVVRNIKPIDDSGCNSEIDVVVTTIASTGFNITSDNNSTSNSWVQGETRTVTWNVANSDGAAVNCKAVDIVYSTDGGQTFPHTLVSNVNNDGSQNVVVPQLSTSMARVMVKPTNNVFLDINNGPIVFNNGTPTFAIQPDAYIKTVCQNQTTVFNVSVIGLLGFTNPVSLSVSGLPGGATGVFSNSTVIPGNSTQLTISNPGGALGRYNLLITGTSGALTINMDIAVDFGSLPGPFNLITPSNLATGVSVAPSFTWSSAAGGENYQFQLSRKSDFSSTILNVSNLTTTTYTPSSSLQGYSTYYWRVRSNSICGASVWQTFEFDTENCQLYSSTNVPITISSSGTPTITSNLSISERGTITDLDIRPLIGTHTNISNLSFTLESPSATSVLFWYRPCTTSTGTANDNFNIIFNQSAAPGTPPCPPTNGSSYQPNGTGVGTLNTFNTLSQKGNWILRIQDLVNTNGGSLTSWGIRACASNFCNLTVDNDFEKGAGSLLAAINCAVDGDTIRFAPTFMNDTITLFTSNIVTNKRLFIDADPAKNIHVMSTGTNPTIVSSTPNTLEGLKIRGLHIHGANNAVGAILNTGLLNLVDVTLHKGIGSSTAVIQNNSGGINNVSGNCIVIPN